MNVVFLSGTTGASTYTAWTDPQTGVTYVGYWPPHQTPSSSASNTTGIAYVGTSTNHTPAVTTTLYQPPAYPAIEDAGIRAGEIIGYRCWKLENGDQLRSIYMGTIWMPGETGQTSVPLNPYGGSGFYAFKTLEDVKCEFPRGHLYTHQLIYGEVALWGQVYEHERGYRAECVRITRIIEVDLEDKFGRLRFWKPDTLTRLRRKYGVPG